MSDITVVEFETSQHGVVHLSELSEGPPFTVHGIALGAGDVTVGQSGVKKKWPATELQEAADSLQGTNLVVDHNNDATGVVGRVTKAGYKEGTGVVYEAELYDEELGEKVKSGLLEVSIRGYHADVDALEEDEETGAKVVEDIKFDNLSIVPTGAAPSNTLQMGEHAELSAAELSAFTDSIDTASLAEVEPGMWVEWDGGKGITISQVQDGEIEVDVYEESDGKWRAIGETKMMSTDSLDEWDVDEEEDIGARKSGDDSDEPESASETEENAPLIEKGMKFYSTINDTMIIVVSVDGNRVSLKAEGEPDSEAWEEPLDEVHEKIGSDEWDHAGHIEEMGRSNIESYTDFSEDDWVQWYPSETSERHGKVVSVDGENEEIEIQTWTQNSNGKWGEGDEVVTKAFDEVGPWGNFPRKQEDFQKSLERGDPRREEAEQLLSDSAEKSLENKVEEHNEEHGDEDGKKVTKTMLKKVYDRGLGAYNDSHREGMTQNQWAMARVNAFLYLVRNGNPENDEYNQDNDLLPEGHPKNTEENAAVSEGDFVQWKGSSDEPMFGQVVGIAQDGQQFMAQVRCYTESGDQLDLIKRKPLQALDKWDGSPEMNADTPDDMRDDSKQGVQAPTWEEGQMVKWQVNPMMRGKIVHVDREKKIIMVEVMEETEQGMQSTGFTVTAGYSDLTPMNEEMAGVSTRDVPTQDAKPEHDTASVDSLLKRFIQETGDSEPSLSDFLDWMNEENLAIERGDGEEEPLTSKSKLDSDREEQPHRYIDAEDEQSELEAKFDDYPEAAKENAQMALDAREETDNPNDCGTDVGWRRAKQLANGEALSRKQLGKMSAFNRHRSNSEQGDDGKADCGWMMWKAWGGDEGVDWAQRKLDSIEEENAMYDVPDDHMFKERSDAEDKAEDLGIEGAHEMDGRWMPGETHEDYMDAVASTSKHGSDDSDDEMDSDEEEEMASNEDMEKSLERVETFMEGDGSPDSTLDQLLDWAGDDNSVQGSVSHFIETVEDGSKKSTARMFKMWLEMSLDMTSSNSGHMGEEASADEGNEVSDVEEELQDYEMHTPDWSGTTENEWSRPDMEDFDTDDLGEIADHFLISSSGFPPENFGDLKLPIVEPNGDLNVNALSAVKGGRGASAVDGLSSDMEDEIMEMMNKLANEEFDRDWGMEENGIGGTSGRPTPGENTVGGVRVLSGDDLQQSYKSGESDADSLQQKITTMTSDIEEKLSELDEPVAVEADEVEELRNKADRFEEMSESLEALRERTDILDEVDRSQVEELAEADDPVVEESARYEELQSEAEQVKTVYAAQLAEQYDAFTAEELTGKFSIEELREKYEDNFGSVEDLASSDEAEPRSQDADEESLEDAADSADEETETEELAEQAAQKQEELKNKILGGN